MEMVVVEMELQDQEEMEIMDQLIQVVELVVEEWVTVLQQQVMVELVELV